METNFDRPLEQEVGDIGKIVTNGNVANNHLYAIVLAESSINAYTQTTVLVNFTDTTYNNYVTVTTKNWQNTIFLYTIKLSLSNGTVSIDEQRRALIFDNGTVTPSDGSNWQVVAIRLIR